MSDHSDDVGKRVLTDGGLASIDPDDDGRKRRQAEYLMLTHVRRADGVNKKTLQTNVRRSLEHLAETDSEPPIYITSFGQRTPDHRREFKTVLNDCEKWGYVERSRKGNYRLTSAGERRIDELESTDKYRINGDFEASLDEIYS